MSLESAIASRFSLLYNVGKQALNIKYPNEFELYIIALELTDENWKTLRYFVFPINPSSIEEVKPQLTNVKKTLGGVTVLKTPTFVPTDITLSGTFGRSFKVLLGDTFQDLVHSFQYQVGDSGLVYRTTNDSVKKGVGQFFDDRVKTGYGCTKILEEIIAESVQKNRRLIFHNPALGNNYLVTAGSLRLSMNEQSNMIWNYSLPLKSIAPLESVYSLKDSESAAKNLSVTNYTQKKTNEVINGVKNLLAKGFE